MLSFLEKLMYRLINRSFLSIWNINSVVNLQISNGLVWPIRMLFFVQLCFWECVIQVFNRHLVKWDHVLEFFQLGKEEKMIRKKKKTKTKNMALINPTRP